MIDRYYPRNERAQLNRSLFQPGEYETLLDDEQLERMVRGLQREIRAPYDELLDCFMDTIYLEITRRAAAMERNGPSSENGSTSDHVRSLFAWASTCVQNRYKDQFRSEGPRRRYRLEKSRHCAIQPGPDLDRRETLAAVREVVRQVRLTDEGVEMLISSSVHGLKLREIAETYGVSHTTVGRRIRSSAAEIRAQLAARDEHA